MGLSSVKVSSDICVGRGSIGRLLPRNAVKDMKTPFRLNLSLIVVDESHTVAVYVCFNEK